MNDSNIEIYAVYKPSNVITIEKFGLQILCISIEKNYKLLMS